MVSTSPKRKRGIFIATIVAMVLVITSVISLYVYAQQQERLIHALTYQLETEGELLASALSEPLLRNDYSEGQNLLDGWVQNHDEVVFLEVRLGNGRTYFRYQDLRNPDGHYKISTTARYGERGLSLTLGRDSAQLDEALARLAQGLAILALSLAVIMGVTLWYVLFRWTIKPLEEEISERKRVANEWWKLSQTVEQNPTAMFITNTEGAIEYANAKFYQATGFSSDEVLGQTPRIIKSPNTPLTVYEELWKTIRSAKVWQGELEDRCKDGSTFWADVTIAPIHSEDGRLTHYFASHEDITMRKEAERKMREAKDEAVVASRAKSNLLANMSHELRTPLNAIIGFSGTIVNEVFGPLGNDKYREYLGDIHHSGQHLLDVINDILDVSAIEADAMELHEAYVNILNVVEVCVRLITPRAQKGGVTIDIALDPNLPMLFADERRIKQILLNLLSNAVKFTLEGGVVTVSSWLNDDGSYAVSVSDTGIGMKTEDVQKAMTTFGQVDSGLNRKHEGSGLGLPLTKGLAELHGGTLEIDSKPGHHTVVTVTFPKTRVSRKGP